MNESSFYSIHEMINVYYVSRTVFYMIWIAFICQTWNVNELHQRCISAFSEQYGVIIY